jgi:preprotein translocase subunit SecG
MNISFGDVLLFGLMLVSLFLMFVILLQRGRGGGLAGAFGGLGGQSAFGTKAGDVFTVITIVTVVIWVILSCLTAWRLRYESSAAARYRGEGVIEPAAGEPLGKGAEGDKAPGESDGSDKAGDSAASSKKTEPAAGGEADSDENLKIEDDTKGEKGSGNKSGPAGTDKKPDTASKPENRPADKE